MYNWPWREADGIYDSEGGVRLIVLGSIDDTNAHHGIDECRITRALTCGVCLWHGFLARQNNKMRNLR